MMTPITPRERNVAFEYVQKSGWVKNPVAILAKEVMLPIFGWPVSSGKKRAKEIILGWEKLGEMQCFRDARGTLTAISATKDKITTQPPKVVVVQRVPEEVVVQPVPEEEPVKIYPVVGTAQPAQKNQHKKKRALRQKGLARERRKAQEKGDKNEDLFHCLASQLIEILKKDVPEWIVGGECKQSGHYNKRKGIVDVADKNGEDERVTLQVREQDGQVAEPFYIYDPKSSQRGVEKYRRRFYVHSSQVGVKVKKAILISKRSHRDIVGEVIDDIQSGLPAHIILDREAILNQFD